MAPLAGPRPLAGSRTHLRFIFSSCALRAEGSPLPTIRIDWDTDDYDHLTTDFEPARHRKQRVDGSDERRKRTRLTRPPRSESDQAFKCGHCKQFIGAPLTGGRHRNHCPNCLWSRHVDHTRPGDRRSDCHKLMAPIGVLMRRNGEQVIIHRCLGCGKEDPNRIAADDSPLLVMRLKPVTASRLEAIPTSRDITSEESA